MSGEKGTISILQWTSPESGQEQVRMPDLARDVCPKSPDSGLTSSSALSRVAWPFSCHNLTNLYHTPHGRRISSRPLHFEETRLAKAELGFMWHKSTFRPRLFIPKMPRFAPTTHRVLVSILRTGHDYTTLKPLQVSTLNFEISSWYAGRT